MLPNDAKWSSEVSDNTTQLLYQNICCRIPGLHKHVFISICTIRYTVSICFLAKKSNCSDLYIWLSVFQVRCDLGRKRSTLSRIVKLVSHEISRIICESADSYKGVYKLYSGFIESSYAVYHKTVSVSFAIKYKSLIARRPTIHIKDMYP